MNKSEILLGMVLIAAVILSAATVAMGWLLWRTWEFVRLVLEMAVRG